MREPPALSEVRRVTLVGTGLGRLEDVGVPEALPGTLLEPAKLPVLPSPGPAGVAVPLPGTPIPAAIEAPALFILNTFTRIHPIQVASCAVRPRSSRLFSNAFR